MRLSVLAMVAPIYENAPESRWKFGSPCRFVRSVDLFVHVLLPEAVRPLAPSVSSYLRSTSPRWGKNWRSW